MQTTGTLVIGAGQAGLAMSRALRDRGREHVVLDRGRVAERWRSERWDSLRLLTPNWMTRLPGFRYQGSDPDGFMTAAETTAFLDRYAASFAAPVLAGTTVERLGHDGARFVVETDRGAFAADEVVVATGWCDQPAVPAFARCLSADVIQVTPPEYRRPTDLPDGGVLVVGASATGVQLADEIHRSGRPVTLAVGSHSRAARRYRGLDMFWWLDRIGAFDQTIDETGDPAAARSEPSLQLAGRPDHRTLDLAMLQADGVALVGRALDIDGTSVALATDLEAVLTEADRRLARLLDRIDAAVDRMGLTGEVLDPEPVVRVRVPPGSGRLDLRRAGIRTVVWATGYRRRYDWLDLPVLDARGEIRQRRGATPFPGAFVLGQRFQHFRNSNFIDGVGRDAEHVAELICTSRRDRSRAHHPARRVHLAHRR